RLVTVARTHCNRASLNFPVKAGSDQNLGASRTIVNLEPQTMPGFLTFVRHHVVFDHVCHLFPFESGRFRSDLKTIYPPFELIKRWNLYSNYTLILLSIGP